MGQWGACAVRTCDLDAGGYIVAGANHLYVAQPVQIVVTAEYAADTELEQRSGCDDICFYYKSPGRFKSFAITMSVCEWDPELDVHLEGGALITSGSNSIGRYMPAASATALNGVGFEAWSKVRDGQQAHDVYEYSRIGIPKTYGWKRGSRTLENGLRIPTYEGIGEANPRFSNGPANDWPEATTDFEDGSPLGEMYHDDIPTVTCGRQTTPAQSGS